MQLPDKCPKCGSKLQYLAEIHLIPDTNPHEAGVEGNCFKCGVMLYSKFRMFETEITLFDENGNEIE